MSDDVPFDATPIARAHAADAVFRQIATAMIRGEIVPGSSLPPERVLGERFGVSRIVARQAVHRLAEMGLARVRQGGATIALDPDDATDLRVLALFYELAPSSTRGSRDRADMIEKQYLQGLSIVEVASRRAADRDLRAVLDLVEAAAADAAQLARFAEFEERFWRALSKACGNRVFRMEVAWWYDALADRPVPRAVAKAPGKIRIAFYRELARRLVEGASPAEFYLSVARPILDEAIGVSKRTKSVKPRKAVRS